jgi:uncharacterized membrane protein YozB (DUF420 family)
VFARWYFPSMAVVMIVMAVAGFAPSIVNPSQRNGPMTLLLAVHGILFFLWLLLFLLQTTLIAARRTDLHRRMGIVAVVLLVALVPLSYIVTVQMVRRGFDLSGDQILRSHPDALFGSIFNFFAVVEFPVLAGFALIYRRRKEIHKRLMLFANMALMGPPITHFLGHFGLLSAFTVLAGLALLFLSAVAGDFLMARRVHPLTTKLAILLFLFQPLQAIVGSTVAWHHFAAWLAR